jgi:hypothetical protein
LGIEQRPDRLGIGKKITTKLLRNSLPNDSIDLSINASTLGTTEFFDARQVKRWNIGGPALVDSVGNFWDDNPVNLTGGSNITGLGGPERGIYQSVQAAGSIWSCTFPVPAGRYTVRLHFLDFPGSEARSVNVNIGSVLRDLNFRILDYTKEAYDPLVRTYPGVVAASDNTLFISLNTVNGDSPILAGVEVIPEAPGKTGASASYQVIEVAQATATKSPPSKTATANSSQAVETGAATGTRSKQGAAASSQAVETSAGTAGKAKQGLGTAVQLVETSLGAATRAKSGTSASAQTVEVSAGTATKNKSGSSTGTQPVESGNGTATRTKQGIANASQAVETSVGAANRRKNGASASAQAVETSAAMELETSQVFPVLLSPSKQVWG